MRKIIALTGKATAGKSTAATYFYAVARRRNYPTHILPFAGPLKRIASEMGWNGKKDDKGRRLLQLLGTECGRECIGEDVWINLWLDSVHLANESACIIADDCRFDNEVETVRSMGGTVVRIVRPGAEGCVGAQAQHASERVPDYCDAELVNDGSFGLLAERVVELCDTRIFA